MTEPVSLPARRLGQATMIEQSRAVAEVQAAIVVAQQCPRDIQAAMRAMRQSCQMPQLAERSFFRFPRAGSTISGPSVYLARELARCWGNIQYGVSELSRDDVLGQSEMQAFAWDLETNARAATIFIVPHMRDKKGGPERLVDMRDVYENNANAGARRVRECIFGILPPWFTEEAKELCTKTIRDGGGVPLPRRISDALAKFAALAPNPVSEDDVARKLGRSSAKWTEHDIAQLGVIYQSIQRGEVSRDEEFPPSTVTADEIVGSARPPEQPGEVSHSAVGTSQPTGDRPEPTASAETAGTAASPGTTEPAAKPAVGADERRERNRLHAMLSGPLIDLNGAKKRDDKLAFLSDFAGRAVDSSDDLTADEVHRIVQIVQAIANAAAEDRPLAIAEHINGGRELRAAAAIRNLTGTGGEQ